MIRSNAIIFDYGNVLSGPQGAAEIAAMASLLDLPVPRFRELYWKSRLAYDEGSLDPETYWRDLARAASRRLGDRTLAGLIETDSRSWSYPAPAIPAWARALYANGVRTAILSNMPAPVKDYITGCPWLPPFHVRVFSCDLRIAKPALEIFRRTVDALGAPPQETLFLDDRPENVRAAESIGLDAVQFTTLADVTRQLDGRFDISVPLVATVDKEDEKNE